MLDGKIKSSRAGVRIYPYSSSARAWGATAARCWSTACATRAAATACAGTRAPSGYGTRVSAVSRVSSVVRVCGEMCLCQVTCPNQMEDTCLGGVLCGM